MLNYFIYACLVYGCFCSAMVVSYANSTQVEDLAFSFKWFFRMMVTAVIGLILIFLK